MNDTTTKDSPLARAALSLCAIWLAAGAYAKLVYGSPTLLPAVMLDHTPTRLWSLVYTLVIGIEFALVALCFLRPRWAWPAMIALFAFFEFVLTTQIAAGAKSCGCFGGGLEVSPKLMMAVDSALLLCLLATKPWASIRSRGMSLGLVAIAFLLAFGIPAIKIRARQNVTPQVPGPNGAAVSQEGKFVVIDPAHWVGKSVYDIEDLTKFVAAEKLPTDGQIVLWRQGCGHCAKHLQELANGDKGDHPIVLIQIQDDLRDSRAVEAMPNGAHVTMLEFPKDVGVSIQTPWDFTVAGGIITEARDPKTLDPDEH